MPSMAQSQTAAEAIAQNREVSLRAEELAKAEMLRDNRAPPAKHTDKYFIMKSLTVEDMELSVRNSIWATQGHNEDALNKAFEVRYSSLLMKHIFLHRVDDGECLPHLLSQQVW